MGVTGPMPVTTTRRRSSIATSGHPQLGRHQINRLADGLHRFHLILGDLDAPLLLEGQDGLDEVERVRVKILRETRVRDDLGLVHGQLLGQDLANPAFDLGTVHPCDPPRVLGPTRLPADHWVDYAVSPPSTGIVAPFTYDASSEDRK